MEEYRKVRNYAVVAGDDFVIPKEDILYIEKGKSAKDEEMLIIWVLE